MNWVLLIIRFVLSASLVTVFTFGVALLVAYTYINGKLEEWTDDNDNGSNPT